MNKENSYRQIVRSSSIIGAASAINIVVGLLRTKVVALLLGPAGVGMIGLFQSLMATGAAVSSLGLGNVGTRQIAEAGNNDESLAAVRGALFWGTLVLGAIGASVFWLFRGDLARYVLGDSEQSSSIGWLAIGVALSVAAGSQTALLNGMRRIGDIARVTISSAVLSTLIGTVTLLFFGSRGLLLFVLVAPFTTFIMGHLFVSRLPPLLASATPFSNLVVQWRSMIRLGSAFMVAGLVSTVGQLTIRALVQRQLGVESLGQFQAAWSISMTYVGFVLAAMGTDYYPRLTAAIRDHPAVNRLANEQTEVALLLAGPVILGMLTFSPWIIDLLYSTKFSGASVVLRWQVLGDVLRVASWPMGFLILASGEGRAFVLTESLAMMILVLLVWFGLPLLGLQVTGVAVVAMYSVYTPVVYWMAWKRTKFEWCSQVKKQILALFMGGLLICLVSNRSKWLALFVGLPLTASFATYCFGRLIRMLDLDGPIGRIATLSRNIFWRRGS